MSPPPTGPKLVELRPNRDLLNAHFEGYKLTLQPLPKLRSALVQPPGRRHTSDDQYSYLHAQLFSTHNHLVRDPYTPGAYYYVDAAGAVHCVRYAADSGRLAEHVRPVFGAPAAGIERYAGDYNATLTFVSGKCAVLADGSGGLSVLETGDRQRQETADETWKRLHAFRPLDDNVATADAAADDDDDSEVPAAAAPFVLLDARLDVEGLYRRVHAVLLHIVKRPDDHTFETVLDWVLVSQQTASNWQCTRLKRLRSRCMPAYCALEARGAALLLAGDQPFVLAGLDDQQSVATVATAIDAELPFGWHQNAEDVIVRFDVPAGAQTADFRVVTERRRVCVTNTGTAGAAVCLLDAELYGDIDAGLTTWLLENETLTLTLVKAGGINGTVDADAVPEEWPQLRRNVVGPPAAEFLDNGRRDAFAMASAGAEMEDMEECDLGGNDAGREFFLERLDAATNTRTHRCSLGTTAPLFTVQLLAGDLPALALRTDVDVCIWQPPQVVGDDAPATTGWRPQHTGTIDALGYVQASKTQKKYLQCSPDLRAAVISEPQRHVFIYQTQCEAAAGLKNRRTGASGAGRQASCGQQRLFSMAAAGEEICGMVVDNEVTVLLTETEVICVQMNA